jgi:hypothetical protein
MSVNPQIAAQGNRGGNPAAKIQGAISSTFGVIGGVVGAFATMNRPRIAAVLIWLMGVYSTSVVMNAGTSVISTTGFDPGALLDNVTIGWYFNHLLGAILLQWIFTTIEAPIFNRQGGDILSIVIVLVDTLINSILVWPIAQSFVSSPAWDFFVFFVYTMTGVFNNGAGVTIANGDLTIALMTLFGSVAIAAAPEMLWARGRRR